MKGLHRTCGLGGNMGKNPLKVLLIQGAITGVVHQRVVQLKNRWRDAEQILHCSSSLTLQATTILVLISTTATRTNSKRRKPHPLRRTIPRLQNKHNHNHNHNHKIKKKKNATNQLSRPMMKNPMMATIFTTCKPVQALPLIS